jgi:hypothetical protein
MKQVWARVVGIVAVVTVTAAYAASEGRLTVTTDPEGVEVWIDERYAGHSPIHEKKLEPGEYSVRLVDVAHRVSVVERVVVREGENTVLDKALVPDYGRLSVTSTPEGANVYLSTPMGTTPLTNDYMVPGKYRVEIRPPGKGYTPAVKEVVVARGGRIEIDEQFERQSPFDLKALVRLGLGAGAIAGFVWAVAEHGNHKVLVERGETELARTAGAHRTAGIVLGSVCVVAFEIVAFF